MVEPRDFADFRVGESGSLDRVVTADDVARFVAVSGDDNPMHVDREFARRMGMGDRVVHGMLTAAYVSTAIGTVLPGPGALWLKEQFNFRAPVFIGDAVHVEVTIRHMSPATRVLVLDVEVRNQHGKVVLNGDAQVQVLEPMSVSDAEVRAAENAIVTGGGRGIGAAIARRLAADGVHVVINYRSDKAAAEETFRGIEADGGKAALVQADVTDPASVVALVATASELVGPIDALINNAGGPTDPTPIQDMTWEAMEAHLASHLRSGFLCIEAVLPGMLERGFGRIVTVTSQSAYGTPPPKMSGYVVAKAAAAAFVRCLALEAGPRGVTANAIAPGMADTTLVADVPPRMKMALAAQTPLRRLARVEDVADVASFLLGPGGSFVTGQTIHLSGGQVMT